MHKPAPSDEAKWVTRARAGDREAFRHLVDSYQPLVSATVAGMLGSSDEVDDVCQETFIRFYEALNGFRGDSSVSTYITRIAINLSLNAIKRRRIRLLRFLSTDTRTAARHEPMVDEGEERERQERAALVQRALDRLDARHRAVVVLRMIDGYTTKETADILDIPLGTVLSRLSRAQEKLKELLEGYLFETPLIQDERIRP